MELIYGIFEEISKNKLLQKVHFPLVVHYTKKYNVRLIITITKLRTQSSMRRMRRKGETTDIKHIRLASRTTMLLVIKQFYCQTTFVQLYVSHFVNPSEIVLAESLNIYLIYLV